MRDRKKLVVFVAFLFVLFFMTIFAGNTNQEQVTPTRKIVFLDGYTDEEISSFDAPLGTDVEAPTPNDYDNNVFVGWYDEDGVKVDSFTNILNDMTVKARYAADINNNNIADETEETYLVNYYDTVSNTLLKSERVLPGLSGIAPRAVNYEGYRFIGWTNSFANIRSNLNINTVYNRLQEAVEDEVTPPATDENDDVVDEPEEDLSKIPEGKITYSNTNPTNENVIATLTVDESITDLDGWTKDSDLVYTKEYEENTTEEIVITNSVDNSITLNVNIENIDKVKPKITVKDKDKGDYLGSKDKMIFSKVSFKLYDEVLLDYYEINGEKKDFSDNKWSDANFENIEEHLNQGKNTIVLYDKAGNTDELEFTYDSVAPTVEIVDVDEYNPETFSVNASDNNKLIRIDYSLWTDDDETQLGVWGYNLNTQEYSPEPKKSYYSLAENFELLKELTDGEYTLKATVKDVAGNVVNATDKNFKVDKEEPKITVKDGFVGNKEQMVFSKVSFKLFDAVLIDYYMINGTKKELADNQWSDANFGNIKNNLVQGKNKITLYDKAGNTDELEFTYDSVAPVINISDKKFNCGMKVVLESNESLNQDNLNGWTNIEGTNNFTKTYSENIEKTLAIKDIAGNDSSVTISVDLAPQLLNIEYKTITSPYWPYFKTYRAIATFDEKVSLTRLNIFKSKTIEIPKLRIDLDNDYTFYNSCGKSIKVTFDKEGWNNNALAESSRLNTEVQSSILLDEVDIKSITKAEKEEIQVVESEIVIEPEEELTLDEPLSETEEDTSNSGVEENPITEEEIKEDNSSENNTLEIDNN